MTMTKYTLKSSERMSDDRIGVGPQKKRPDRYELHSNRVQVTSLRASVRSCNVQDVGQ